MPMRLLIYAMAPLYALRLRWFGTRASIAKVHGLEDLTSRDETLRWSADYAAMGDALLLARDDRLLGVMGRYLDRKSATKRRLAIVYGAQHMRAVIRERSPLEWVSQKMQSGLSRQSSCDESRSEEHSDIRRVE